MAPKRKSDPDRRLDGRKKRSADKVSTTSETPATASDGKLAYNEFPHILESVIRFAPRDSLVQLRRVSKHVKKLAEAELCRHLVIYPDYGIVMTTRRGTMVNVGVGTLEEGGRVQANPTFNAWYNDYIDTYRPMPDFSENFLLGEDEDDEFDDDDESDDDDDDDDEEDDDQEPDEPDFDSDDGDPNGYDIDEENVPDLGAALFPQGHPPGNGGNEVSDDDSELSFSSEGEQEEAMALMQMLVQQTQILGNESIVPPTNANGGPIGHAGELLAAAIAAANGNGGAGDSDSGGSSEGEGGWETFSDEDDDDGDTEDEDDGLSDGESDLMDDFLGRPGGAFADTGDEYSSEEEMGIEEFSHRLPEQAAIAMKNAEVVDIFQRPPYRGIIRLMRATNKVHSVRYHLPYAQPHSMVKCFYASNAPRVVQFSLLAPIKQYDLFDEGNPGSALGRSTRFVDSTKLRRGCKKAVFNVAYDVGCKGLRNGRIRFDDYPDTVEEVVLILTKTAWDMKPTAKGNRRDARPYDGKGWFEEFVLTEASKPTHKLTIVGLQDVPPGALSLKRDATPAEKIARFDYRMHEAKRLLTDDNFTRQIYWEMEGPSENWDAEFKKYMDDLEYLTHDEYKARLGAAEWSIENEILPGVRHGS